MKRKVYNVGVTDVGMTDGNGKHLRSYCTWNSMIERCYNKKRLEKHPTYVNCTVSDEWKLYSNFKKFYDENYVDGLFLDKDLLQDGVVNKVYSSNTCLFVPRALNNFFTNHKSSSVSDYRGTSWKESHKKWVAQIKVNNHETGISKVKHLGLFTDPELSELVYDTAREIEAMKWRTVMINDYGWSSELASYIK